MSTASVADLVQPLTTEPAPPGARPRGPGRLGDRIVRQVGGIDAWNAASRAQAQALTAGGRSREGRVDCARRLDVLRRTHAALTASTVRELARDPAPMQSAPPTAVVVHSHQWFVDAVGGLLAAHGVEVLERTSNAADALGVIIAEQPDLVVVGQRLVMMSGADLLAETAVFSPLTVVLAQVDGAAGLALEVVDAAAAVPGGDDDVTDTATRVVAATRSTTSAAPRPDHADLPR